MIPFNNFSNSLAIKVHKGSDLGRAARPLLLRFHDMVTKMECNKFIPPVLNEN